MDFDEYRRQYFADPPPAPRFDFTGLHGLTLYYADYEAAVDYYQRVLGPPAYVEGAATRSWLLGDSWLTLLRGQAGAPRNAEMTIVMRSPAAAEALHAAFIAAGGTGPAPTDELMHAPVRFCAVTDPFGCDILVISPLPTPRD